MAVSKCSAATETRFDHTESAPRAPPAAALQTNSHRGSNAEEPPAAMAAPRAAPELPRAATEIDDDGDRSSPIAKRAEPD